MHFAAFNGTVPLQGWREEVCWVCMSVKFPRWQADRVILLDLAPEHNLPVLNRHNSLEFLCEEEKPVLGLAADLCSRDFEFIHLKDAYSFGIYYPPPPQCQAELTDNFSFCVLCYLTCFPGLKVFTGETSFLDIKSTALGDFQSFCICFGPVHTFYWKGLLCSNWTGTIQIFDVFFTSFLVVVASYAHCFSSHVRIKSLLPTNLIRMSYFQ